MDLGIVMSGGEGGREGVRTCASVDSVGYLHVKAFLFEVSTNYPRVGYPATSHKYPS